MLEEGLFQGAAPADKWHLCYFLLFFQGLGVLFPWNTFITSKPYFDRRMCGSSLTDYYYNFFTFSYQATNLLGLVLCVKYQHMYPLKTRVLAPMSATAVIFIYISICVLIPPESMGPLVVFLPTLFCTTLAGACSAIIQGGLFGLAGMLPPIYTQAVMGGQGLGGLVVAFAGVLTPLIGEGSHYDNPCDAPYSETKWSSFAFFSVSAITLILTVAGFIVLDNHNFVRHHTKKHLDHSTPSKSSRPNTERNLLQASHVGSDEPTEVLIDEEEAGTVDKRMVFRQVMRPAFNVMMVFAVTLMVFPTVTASVTDSTGSKSKFFSVLWVPMSFLNFNTFDFLGRIFAGWFTVDEHSFPWMTYACVARIAFVPLFLLCHTGGAVPDLLNNDWFPIVLMIIFAFSNGLFSSFMMMTGPMKVKSAAQQNIAGTMMATSICFGLTLGSLLSLALLPLMPH